MTTLTQRSLAIGIAIVSFIAVLRPVRAAAQDVVPPLVQISGDLFDQKGKPLTGTQAVTFALYKDQSGDAPLWVEVQTVTADAKGHFIALLGATSPGGLPLTLFSTGQARWLGMQPSGLPELPRTFLASVPYALAPLSAIATDTQGGAAATTATDSTAVTGGSTASASGTTSRLTATGALAATAPPSPVFTIVTDSTSGLASVATNNGATVTLNLIKSCASGQLLKWNGTSWGCTADTDVTIDVSGGGLNVLANATSPNIVGGFSGNSVTAGAFGAAIGGGGEGQPGGGLCPPFPASCNASNRVAQSFGTIGGGESNQAGNSAGVPSVRSYATVGGGNLNVASGLFSTVPGGTQNAATGSASFAAGFAAKANHNGTFVWSDQSGSSFASTAANQFLIHASGGVGIGTNAPTTMLDVRGHFNLQDANNNGVFVFPSTGSGLFIRSGVDSAYTERMFISGLTGRVGIGTTDPSQLLDVAGNVKGNQLCIGTDCRSAWPSGGVTSILAGSGLTAMPVNPITSAGILSVNTAQIQSRVVEGCVAGSAIRMVNADGSVVCESTTGVLVGIGGTGTPNFLPRFTAPNVLGNSQFFDSGDHITIGTLGTLDIAIGIDGGYKVQRALMTPSLIGGFEHNSVSTGINGATISGGGGSSILDPNRVTADYGTVAGGSGNEAQGFATVSGGSGNTAAGQYSAIPGGIANEASGYWSYAAGNGAQAVTDATFVWNDSVVNQCPPLGECVPFQIVPFRSTAPNQFLIHAAGGVGIGTNAPKQAVDVVGNVKADGLCIGTDCRTAWPSGGGGTITGVTALTGLTGGGTSGNVAIGVDFATTQKRVSGNCAAGTAVQNVNGDGTVGCVAIGSAGLTGAGQIGFLPKYTGPTSVADSQITDDGSRVFIGTPTVFGKLAVQGGTDIAGAFQTNVIGGIALVAQTPDTGDNNAETVAVKGISPGIGGVAVDGEAGGIGVQGVGSIGIAGVSTSPQGIASWFKSTDATGTALLTKTSDDLSALVVKATGKVGILNDNPGEALDVNGNVKANGLCIGTDCRTAWPSGAGSSTITGVSAGAGLTGGGTTGTVTLGIAPGGVTNAMLTNPSITLNAGAGLLGGGAAPLGGSTSLSVDFATTQKRVANGCTGTNAIQTVNGDGSVACVPIVGGVGGSGTQDTLPKFLVGGLTIGSSRVTDNGTTISLGDGGSGRWTLFGNVTSPNIIGGINGNLVGIGVVGGTVAGGGEPNLSNGVFGQYGFVGGGGGNAVGAYGVVGGGRRNQASGLNAAIDGGENNTADGDHAVVGGGSVNHASGSMASIVGGSNNIASGNSSFAAGTRAFAVTDGTFVWSDPEPFSFSSTAPNQFLIRASGGVGIGINNPGQALDVAGNVRANGLCIGTDCRTAWPTSSGGTITGVTANAGLTGGGTSGNVSLSVDYGATQARVSGACAIGTAIQTVNGDGTVACVPVVSGLGGTGTANALARFVDGATLGPSQIIDDGTNVTIGGSAGGLKILRNTSSPNLIGGYSGNSIDSTAVGATIAGGGNALEPNRVTAPFGFVGGGSNNQAGDVGGQGQWAAVGGGELNSASGDLSTVPGGIGNVASGSASFAAGSRAKALTTGAFVWSDVGSAGTPDFASTAPNQFLIRASGGVGIGVNNPGQALEVAGNVKATGLCIGTDCRTTWPSSTGTITGVTAGAGLTGGGTTGSVTLAVDPVAIQSRVSGMCAAGFAVQAVNQDGSVACGPISAGGGIGGSGSLNTIPRFTDATTLGNSQIYDDGTVSMNILPGLNSGMAGAGGIQITAGGVSPSIIGGFWRNSGGGAGTTIGGGGQVGLENRAFDAFGTIGGGYNNHVGLSNSGSNAQDAATVGGGTGNTASNGGSVVGGGFTNTASGLAATVPGGQNNTAAGDHSFAAGTNAAANNVGSFVWADDSIQQAFTSTANNQFNVRAAGGVRIFSNSALTAGVTLAAGSGSWSIVSDRSAKENFKRVDGSTLLKKLNAIDFQTWNYKSQDAAIRHMGPMAQDFYAAFGLGEDNTHISTVDADGVALAGVQALYRLIQDRDERIAAQTEQLRQLRAEVDALKALLVRDKQ